MERLEAMEGQLGQVQGQQEQFQGLESLLGNVDSVLHFDSISAQYRKKVSDLAQKAAQVTDYVSSLRSKSASFQSSSAEALKDLARRRDREVKGLEARTAGVEARYQQLLAEGKGFGKRVVAGLEGERQVFTQRIEEKLEIEKEEVKVSLEKEKTAVRADLEQVKVLVKSGTKANAAYAKKYGDQLKTALPKASRPAETIEAGKTAMLEDAKARVGAGNKEINQELQHHCTSLLSGFHSSLLSVSSQLHSLQSAVAVTPSLAGRGLHLITCIRLHLDSLHPYLPQQAQAYSHVVSSLSERLTKLKTAEPTEESKAALLAAEAEIAPLNDQIAALASEMDKACKQLDACFDLVTGLETSVQSEVPQKRVAVMKRFRREVRSRQYEVKQQRAQAELEKAQGAVGVLQASVRVEEAEKKPEAEPDLGLGDE